MGFDLHGSSVQNSAAQRGRIACPPPEAMIDSEVRTFAEEASKRAKES